MSASLLPVIAIDGPSGSGKSTTARQVASRLGWQFLDTGAMYRALALAVVREGGSPRDEEDVRRAMPEADISFGEGDPPPVMLGEEDVSAAIRTPAMGEAASQVSSHGFVREAMVRLQRELGLEEPSVLEGRDTTTVIFPDAGLKVFLDASLDVRARRRLADFRAQGDEEITLEQVREDLKRRDERDSGRAVGPLRQAPDALVVDTSGLTIEDQVQRIVDEAKHRFEEAGS